MSEMDLLTAISQVGFPIAVAAFLLWKGYTQDREYMQCLKEMHSEIRSLKEAIEDLKKG